MSRRTFDSPKIRDSRRTTSASFNPSIERPANSAAEGEDGYWPPGEASERRSASTTWSRSVSSASRSIRTSAILCPSGRSRNCRIASARMIEGAVKSRRRSRRSPTLRRETWRIARQLRLPIRGSKAPPSAGGKSPPLSTLPGFTPYVERPRDTTKRRLAGAARRSCAQAVRCSSGSVVVARGLITCCARALRGPTLAVGSALGETWLASRLSPIVDA
jgi:hypothetical protein